MVDRIELGARPLDANDLAAFAGSGALTEKAARGSEPIEHVTNLYRLSALQCALVGVRAADHETAVVARAKVFEAYLRGDAPEDVAGETTAFRGDDV